MRLHSRLSTLVLALAAALPLGLVGKATCAQTVMAITADRFWVDAVRTLSPGAELAFQLMASPGAEVTLQITGATGSLRLDETSAGVYQGSYTVRLRDKLTATSLVTARIVKSGQVFIATLDQSLLRGAPSPVQAARIGAFSVNAPERIRAGDELKFSLSGVPGGTARAVVQGLAQPVVLTEVSRGLYEGVYTVARKDRLRGDLVATGYLKVGQREVNQRYSRAQTAFGSAYGCELNRPERAAGTTCAVITAVGKAEVDDDDSKNVLGTVAGGVLGAVIGNQVGGGSGKDIARIVGAIGGAYAGNRIQNSRSKTTVYRVTVQMDDGTTKNFDHAVDPVLSVGARVKIVDGAIVRR